MFRLYANQKGLCFDLVICTILDIGNGNMPQVSQVQNTNKTKRSVPIFHQHFVLAPNLQPGFADISKILTRLSSAVLRTHFRRLKVTF